MKHLSVKFAFKYAEYKLNNDVQTAFIMAGDYFKKRIKAIAISHKGDKRSYLFSDNTFCSYFFNGDYFTFKP